MYYPFRCDRKLGVYSRCGISRKALMNSALVVLKGCLRKIARSTAALDLDVEHKERETDLLFELVQQYKRK